jgi:hypothetical protein
MHLGRLGYFPYTIDVPGREHAARSHANRPAIPPSVSAKRKGITMRISDFCFIFAGLAALTGMGLGIRMGISQDFTLSPAHAHLNLLGWVTMALYGLYHNGTGRTRGALGWTQVLAGAVGAALMSGGLAAYLASDDHSFMPLIVGGSLATVLGMALFVVIVLVDRRSTSPARTTATDL